MLKLFDEAQDEPRKEARKKSWLAGIGMGSAQCLTFMSWALDFWFGGKLVESGQISAGDVFKTFFILVSTGKVIAEAGSMTSDLAKGSAAVASVFQILDRQSLMAGGPPSARVTTCCRRSHMCEVLETKLCCNYAVNMQLILFPCPSTRPEMELTMGSNLGISWARSS